jgi:hypothetical protein
VNVKRREFLELLRGASMAWPLTAVAQSRKPATLGILVARNPDPTQLIKGIKEGLGDLGYVAGTANALGLTLPANLLTRADDVIE